LGDEMRPIRRDGGALPTLMLFVAYANAGPEAVSGLLEQHCKV
jgi:hypothetical protein